MKFPAGILGALVLCFLVQGLCYYELGLGAVKTESNYFSSLLRLEAAMRPGAEMVVVGSSMTGRLPGREAGNEAVANLGVDGGSMRDGLAMLAEGVVPLAPLVVVETNTLQAAVEQPPSALRRAARGLWTRLGSMVPLVGAAARPSGMLYNAVLERARDGGSGVVSAPNGGLGVPEARVLAGEGDPIGRDLEVATEVVAAIGRVRERGGRVLLVNYPPGNVRPMFQDRQNILVRHLSRVAGVPYFDLDADLSGVRMEYTDGVHLDRRSAGEVLRVLKVLAETSAPGREER